MNYFDETNEALKPYAVFENFVLYNIDSNNMTAGLEIYIDNINKLEDAEKLIYDALSIAFDKNIMNKVYVNVIRDNYIMYELLHSFNFISEAIHRRQYYDGKFHDVVYMTVTKEEWELGGIKYMFKYNKYNVEPKK